MFLKRKMNDSTNSYSDKILQIKEKIGEADAVVIGAGAGFSTSAGFVYNGERFEKYFSDFRKKYGFSDMYSGNIGKALGILVQVYLYQPLYECSQTSISEPV